MAKKNAKATHGKKLTPAKKIQEVKPLSWSGSPRPV